MSQIAGPRHPGDHPDRSIDCQLAMEPAFQDLQRAAIHAGWTEDEVAYALLELAGANIKGMIADRETASWLRGPRA